jgi:CysZ protein
MNKSRQISLGIKTYGQAVGFIFRNKLAWTFLVPIALNILLFIGGQALISDFKDYLEELLFTYIDIKQSGFWGGALSWVLTIFINILFILVFVYISGFIVLIILSPLLAYLSEKTEKILTKRTYDTSVSQLIQDVFRGIAIALRNLFIEILFIVAMFFVGFIPVIGLLGALVLFLVSAYFYGFSFIDYTNERKRLTVRESVGVVRRYRWLAISNGGVFALFLMVPFCGAFLSVFVAIVSVVAATLAMNKTNAYSSDPD